VIGIDIGKNSSHIVSRDERGAIVLRQKWSRGQVVARFTNMPPSCCQPRWRYYLAKGQISARID
jgi:hypothetical protein